VNIFLYVVFAGKKQAKHIRNLKTILVRSDL